MDTTYSLMRIKIIFVSLFFMTASLVNAQDTLIIDLDQALEIAMSENPTIRVADKEISLKKESRKEAFAGLFPEIGLSGSYSRALKKQTMVMDFGSESNTIQVGSDNTYSGGVTVSLPVYAPALYKSIKMTRTDVELALEKSRASKLDLVNQVTKAFYQLLLSQDSYEVLKRSYAQSEDNYNIVNAKYVQGTVSEYDKISAEVQMRSLKPSVVSAANGVNLAKLQLKVLLGVEPDLQLGVKGQLKDYEMEMFRRELFSEPFSLNNNSDLKQLDLNERMLQQNLKLQRTNFLPTLGASFNYMYTSLNNDFKIAHYRWFPYSTFGLSLNIPIFKAGDFTKTKQTKIQLSQLVDNRINVRRQLNMQVTSYMDNMSASTEQVLSNKVAVSQAEKGRLIAEKRYEVGKGTILELNNSEVALTQAELVYNQSIYDYLTAKADLDKVLGIETPVMDK